MGFIREPEGVDFVIAPSLTAKEDIAYISSCIRQHKTKDKADKRIQNKANAKQKAAL
ncbi:MAG: hypothetical protein LBT24_01110 [Tannerella sp.]|jgi:hypothetical protein|nr:hypothetical protein [Tannerella sp.]